MLRIKNFSFVALTALTVSACAQGGSSQGKYIEADGKDIAATGDNDTDAFLMSINNRHRGSGR